MWRKLSIEVQAKGLTTVNTNGLAGLAAARQQHEGQFFTPEPVARFVWNLVLPSLNRACTGDNKKVAILDNSIGSGRLLAFADPKRHSLYGVDTDARCIEALSKDAKEAEFDFDFQVASMAEIRPHAFAAAIINPPFSVTLEDSQLQPFPCNTHGKFGACTRAISHRFALAQALDSAAIVAAIVPRTLVAEAREVAHFNTRLGAIFHLPSGTFSNEGAEVETSVLLFGPEDSAAIEEFHVDNLDVLPKRYLFEIPELPGHKAYLGHAKYSDGPAVTIPVTNDPTVRVIRGGRRIHLKFACGLTQARVLNAIYKAVLREETVCIEDIRHPKEFTYIGEGVLFINVHLAQPDPVASFESFINTIRRAGGKPDVCKSLRGFIRNQTRKQKRLKPFGHIIRDTGEHKTEIVPPSSFPLNPKKWGSPIIKAGQTYQIGRTDSGQYTLSQNGKEIGQMEAAAFEKRFAKINMAGASGWKTKYPSLQAIFPQVAQNWRARAKALGIDQWLTWGYQFEDLIELCIAPGGGVAAWEMGLGKARLAIALCLLRGGTHNLITVEAHLIHEMVSELRKIKLPEELWQAIGSPEDLKNLRKINIISYNRLRMPISRTNPKKTYASQLRHRIRLLVADEGHLLRHTSTDQTRALWKISAGIRLILSGTPIANYPRDILSVVSYVHGDATPAQPYGLRGMFLTPELLECTAYSVRGMDKFREDYCVMEWVTNEFAEDMEQGAKREIPIIANLEKYRALIAPLIKRRIATEPDVSAYINIPTPTERVTTVQWDPEHLDFYLRVAEEFRNWYSELRRRGGSNGRQVNLIALLARIGAVVDAVNQPHLGVRDFAAYTPFTSKQRAVVDRIEEIVARGEKLILFAHSPKAVTRLHHQLEQKGLESILMHGNISQAQRTRDLQDEFRLGSVPICLATHGVARTGLNIPEASYVIFYDRDWCAYVERQAKARVLRPQQQRPVTVEYFHLPGSVDDYQSQLVAFKSEAADSGLDWATPTQEATNFLHLDTILGRFVEDLGKLLNVDRQNLRQTLRSTTVLQPQLA